MSTEIQEYTQTEAALADLRSRYDGVVWEVATTKGMDAAKKARAEVRGYRTSLEALRKEIKAPALERCRLIDEEAKRITAELEKIEDPIDALIKAEEKRKEAEKAEKERIERERVAAIQDRIKSISLLPARHVGQPSHVIELAMHDLDQLDIELDEFAEFTGQAIQAKTEAFSALENMRISMIAHEAEQERLEAERKAMEEAKAKAEAEAAEQRRIEAEKLAAERAELERLRAEQEAAAAAAKAEKDRIEAEFRAEIERKRAEHEAVMAAEREEQQRIAAKLRAEIERQEAEKRKAEAEAQAAKDAEAAAAIAKAEAEHQARIAEYALKAQLAAAAHAARLAGRPSDDMIIDALCEKFNADRLTVVAWLEDMNLETLTEAA